MLLDVDESQLVLVDYQERLMPVIFDREGVVANALRLAAMARTLSVPVWGTAQSPDKLGPNLAAIDAAIGAAGGRTLPKSHFNACADGLAAPLRSPARQAPGGSGAVGGGNIRSLPRHLQRDRAPPQDEAARNTIVIAGCEAHVCLMQTALGLLEEEFEVWVVTDACSSRSERSRDAAFDRLAGNGAELVTTEMVGFEWLRTARHPRFRDVLAVIK